MKLYFRHSDCLYLGVGPPDVLVGDHHRLPVSILFSSGVHCLTYGQSHEWRIPWTRDIAPPWPVLHWSLGLAPSSHTQPSETIISHLSNISQTPSQQWGSGGLQNLGWLHVVWDPGSTIGWLWSDGGKVTRKLLNNWFQKKRIKWIQYQYSSAALRSLNSHLQARCRLRLTKCFLKIIDKKYFWRIASQKYMEDDIESLDDRVWKFIVMLK